MNPTKNRGWPWMIPKDKQLLLHMWQLLGYSCYKSDDKSLLRKGLDRDYDKRNSFMIICDTDTS